MTQPSIDEWRRCGHNIWAECLGQCSYMSQITDRPDVDHSLTLDELRKKLGPCPKCGSRNIGVKIITRSK